MKKTRIFVVVLLAFLCLIVFCSCRCNPAEVEWYIYRIYHDVEYANGQTLRAYTDASIHTTSPTGVHTGQVNIKFYEDGTVIFKPYDSEALRGTFELKHNGYQDTNFTVTFENGERIEDGFADAYYGGRDLEFTFRGIEYKFGDYSGDTVLEKNYDATIRGIIHTVREGHYDLHKGIIENGIIYSDGLVEEADLYSEGLAVTTVHITDNDELKILDEIREGECFFACYGQLYVDGFECLGVVIYYVDPLPSELPPEEPPVFSIFDVVDGLEYYFEHPENLSLMLSIEHVPAQAGKFNKYLVTDQIEIFLKSFYELKLVESPEPPYNIDSNHIKYGVQLSDVMGEHSDIAVYCEGNMIFLNGLWYDILQGSFPTWEGGRPTMTFSCNDPIMNINGTNDFYSVENIEFMPDSKQDYGYDFDKPEILLTGEIGEILVYDSTHFYYNGNHYIVTGEQDFSAVFP